MMFTPQKVLSGWLSGARDEKNGSGNSDPNCSNPNKGFGVGDLTPKGLVSNVGVLDQDVVVDKINKLEKELYEYQYNMGLLLIEKKEWISKNEQFEQALAETKELLQREQTAHLIAMSEVEKREEKLRKALGVEKQCVHELEKSLREMRSEYAEIKFTADSKLEEAHALSTSIEGRSLEVEAKLRSADAKLAEISRKSSEIQRKATEIEAKESSLMRERVSFNNERDAHERSLSHQREDLREWEKKLQEGEEKLVELRRLINQREELANDNDKIVKQKQLDLEEEQKKIEIGNAALKAKDDEISTRMKNVALKEKEAAVMRKNLEVKEKELQGVEEKLNAREKVEIQKLKDEHKAILDAKTREFELEMEEKRKSLDDEFKVKVIEVEKKEVEVNHLEGKIAKREQALEKKLEKINSKEKDVDVKLKELKEKEKTFKAEQKTLEKEREKLRGEMEFENRMRERERSLEEERERELANVQYLRDVASREMQEVKLERAQLEKEKHDVFANQKHLESQQLEMKNDIDSLVGLSVKLKDQREQFLKERERFVAFVEKQKGCKECGERVSAFVLSDLQSLAETKNADEFALPKLADGYLKESVQVTSESKPNVGTSIGNSGSPGSGSRTLNWLKKCTFIFSAGKKNEQKAGETEIEAQEKLVDVGEIPEFILSSEDEPEVSARVVPDSFDVQRDADQSADEGHKNIAHEIEEVAQQPDENEGQSKSTKRQRPRATRATRSKATSDNNGVVENSVYTNEVSQGVSKGGGRKRTSEQEPAYSEQSDSVTNGGRRTRRKKVAEAPKVARYNLRRSTRGASSNQSKEDGIDSKVQPGASTTTANGGLQANKKVVDDENEFANKLPEDMALSEEVTGTPQQVRENHNDDHEIQTQQEEDDGDGDSEVESDDDEETEHPGEVSIGRKLWTFIST
ncbi:putative protein crowded nuclei [Helianthus annuus]|nr:putative protein crowded nuclei [Helianthus annuus]